MGVGAEAKGDWCSEAATGVGGAVSSQGAGQPAESASGKNLTAVSVFSAQFPIKEDNFKIQPRFPFP